LFFTAEPVVDIFPLFSVLFFHVAQDILYKNLSEVFPMMHTFRSIAFNTHMHTQYETQHFTGQTSYLPEQMKNAALGIHTLL
jgi:hypothetical protein